MLRNPLLVKIACAPSRNNVSLYENRNEASDYPIYPFNIPYYRKAEIYAKTKNGHKISSALKTPSTITATRGDV